MFEGLDTDSIPDSYIFNCKNLLSKTHQKKTVNLFTIIKVCYLEFSELNIIK